MPSRKGKRAFLSVTPPSDAERPGKPHADAAPSPLEYDGGERSLFRRHDALGDAKLIARIFYATLRESKRLNEDVWSLKRPIFIKRFIVPPL